ncbi:hypothetical protein BJ138DRAFT_1163919 [Hygrophoropsis aurantiaca]|uniref:Uncharacterized protein n=1 Tax=Hygrophoropsis aurantiaca TaxID=72124 RepID=A0ACB7ZYK6_9AGAM|nr:hypothetical protein BJ138DRAFT_1163919 [Hygrophoropsis aurantiaca]
MSLLFRCNLGTAHDLDPDIKLYRFGGSSEDAGHYYLSQSIDLLGKCRAHAIQAGIHSKEEIDAVRLHIISAQRTGSMLMNLPRSINPVEVLKRRRLRQKYVNECLEVLLRAKRASDDIMNRVLAVPSVCSRNGEVTAGSIPPDTEICGFVVPPVEDQASSEGTDSFFTAPEFAIEDPMPIPRLSGSSEPILWKHDRIHVVIVSLDI